MNKIQQIYYALLKEFGPQGWWPIINEKTLICEYHVNAPRSEKEALEICFGAILTQNTSWKNAQKALINLNRSGLIDVGRILKIDGKKLAQIIKPSGYHNQKAKKLKNFCGFLSENYNGKLGLLFRNKMDKLRKELLSINGVGPETSDSIMLYSAKKPIFVIDAYAKRIMGRVGYEERTYGELQKLFMGSLPNNERLFNEHHALLVELGKNACRKKPLCEICPIKKFCNYHKNVLDNNNRGSDSLPNPDGCSS